MRLISMVQNAGLMALLLAAGCTNTRARPSSAPTRDSGATTGADAASTPTDATPGADATPAADAATGRDATAGRDASNNGDADSGVVVHPDAGNPTSGRTPWPMGTRYIQSGHSLTDTVMAHPYPGRLVEAIGLDPAGDFNDVGKATIPGAPISWRWTHEEDGGDQSAQWPADMPRYQGLVITPAVPLYADDATRQEATVDWLLRAVEDAWTRGNGGQGAPTLLYTTWTQTRANPEEPHPEDNLPFRTRLQRDEARWEAMQDFVNARKPAGQEPVYLIPAHRLMMRISDDIAAGTAPFSNINDIFGDDIHPNAVGMYAVTLMHYACIYGRDPGSYLPDRLADSDNFPASTAQYLKRIVREEVIRYSARTGLTSLSTR